MNPPTMVSENETQGLTSYLLNLDAASLQAATQVRFLEQAGKGELSKPVLQQWLAQDRLYAQSYQRFAALLLANVELSSGPMRDVNEQIADLLVDALANIRRELKFFEDVAGRYGLDVGADEVSEGVKGYRELFRIGDSVQRGAGLLDGLVLLWGTEIVRFLPPSLPSPLFCCSKLMVV